MNLKILALALCIFLNSGTGALSITGWENPEKTIVAVIDSKINTEHEYLQDRCLEGESFILDKSNETGHGTSVAGAVLKYSDIVAKSFFNRKGNVEILPVEINALDQQEDYGYLMGEAIQYSVDMGAEVINMSFSSASPNLYIYEKIRYGLEKGVIFVSAAGNAGLEIYSFPAAYEEVISVGSCSLNEEGNWERSSFSNFNDDVDFVLPGEKMLLPAEDSSYSEKTGTSYSAGAMSGIIGELINRYESIDPQYIIYALYDTSVGLKNDPGCSYGLPDINKAILYLNELISTGISPMSRISMKSTENMENKLLIATENPVFSAGRSHIAYLDENKVYIEGSKNAYRGNVSKWSNITKVYAGYDNTAAVDSNGLPKAVGYNVFNKNIFRGWTDVKALTLSYNFTAALTNKGTIFVTDYLKNSGTESFSGIKQISSGAHHITAVDENGNVHTAGFNIYGQMDTQDWKDIVYISSCTKNTYGIDKYGKVFAAGDNLYSQCDLDDWSEIVSVAAGDGFVIGLRSDGTVLAKGRNIYGVCETDNLKDIIFIDAADTYFIAVDNGNNSIIKGKIK